MVERCCFINLVDQGLENCQFQSCADTKPLDQTDILDTKSKDSKYCIECGSKINKQSLWANSNNKKDWISDLKSDKACVFSMSNKASNPYSSQKVKINTNTQFNTSFGSGIFKDIQNKESFSLNISYQNFDDDDNDYMDKGI